MRNTKVEAKRRVDRLEAKLRKAREWLVKARRDVEEVSGVPILLHRIDTLYRDVSEAMTEASLRSHGCDLTMAGKEYLKYEKAPGRRPSRHG